MMTSARARYAGYRFPSEIISHAVWLYFRFPLGRHRQLVASGQLNLGDRQLIETDYQLTLQISAQISNFWVLDALCSAAVT